MTLEDIKRLFRYYLDCVRNEEGVVVHGFPAGDQRFFAPFPLSTEWTVANQQQVRLNLAVHSAFRSQWQRLGQKAALLYGYPVYLEAGQAYPVFLYRQQHELVNDNIEMELPVEWPEVNPEFMDLFFRTREEKRSFLERLGLLETPDDPPVNLMRQLVKFLMEEFPDSAIEQLNTDALANEPRLAATNQKGFYNRAFVLLGEASPFTVGLIRELKWLAGNLSERDVDESALRCLSGEVQQTQAADQNGTLIEVVPLNEEQRDVMASAFTAPFTVVTGPPGTGKSQVILSILANAYWRGQKVLFASRNNKAVEVVEQRLNNLTGHKVIVRSGRKYRPDLIGFLNTISSVGVTNNDREEFRQAKTAAEQSEDRQHKLWQDAEHGKRKRDRVEKLYRQIQSAGLLAKLCWPWRCLAYWKACRQLEQTPTPSDLAAHLLDLEQKMCTAGLRLLRSYVRTLPDRVPANGKATIGNYLANLQQLQLDGAASSAVLRQQERLFPAVARVLPIWSVTNLSANGAFPLQRGLFDLVIIDEASQCDIPSVLPLLYRAQRAVIIGDPHQLRHIATIKPRQDTKLFQQAGFADGEQGRFRYITTSTYGLAATVNRARTFDLREHFRSHEDIITFSNRQTQWYDGRLEICTDYRQLHAPDGQLGVHWHDVVSQVKRPKRGGAIAEQEAQVVATMVRNLVMEERFSGSVGVVTPFREQANRVRELLNEQVPNGLWAERQLMVEVVHSFQGDERDVMFFSPCVGIPMPDGAHHFLRENGNLINVAITRARASLQIVGNKTACRSCGIGFLGDFVAYVESRQAIAPIPPGPEVGENERPFGEAMLRAGLHPMHQYKEHQYWLDFAIKELQANGQEIKLNIEVDGWQHLGSRQDILRDRRLMLLNWHVKRFWNYQIRDHLEECVVEVLDTLKRLRSEPLRRQ